MIATADSSVQYLKGVGPGRALLLKRLGIESVENLLYFFPRAYLDRRSFTPIAELRKGTWATIRSHVLATGLTRTRSGKPLFRLMVGDGSGTVACTWFNQPYLQERFRPGEELVLSGKVLRYGALQLVNPEYEELAGEEGNLLNAGRIAPVYPLTGGLSQKFMRAIVRQALERFASGLPDMLPASLRSRWKLVESSEALRSIHFPSDYSARDESRKRLIFDEFFLLQLGLALRRQVLASGQKPIPHAKETPLLDRFIRSLPFVLTRAQQRVIWEIKRDMIGPRPMNRLLQGEVGSGKTVVAAGGLLITVGNGYQGAIMAPTEILAAQHFRTLEMLLRPLGVKTELLTGGVTGWFRQDLLERVRSGETDILVGTQALIQEKVAFRQLGMVVIDEQHKFGVRERAELREKGWCPHVLVMTATPIPRTLTMTIYGSLDVSVIDELPPGRKRVSTAWIGTDALPRAHDFIRKEVEQGRQAYIIYPLIEEAETGELKAAREMFARLQAAVFPGLRLGLIHGRMSAREKDKAMVDFRDNLIQILVSTVVVEIGIDVPNATVMLVENAERFGLAQLHQLRGRVGRSQHQSYCILQGSPRTESALRRLRAMKNIDDGFRIAQEDLEIRGPGEFFGTRQHGLPELRIGSIVADVKLMEFARRQAFALVERDKALSDPAVALIRDRLLRRYGEKLELGRFA